jgi:hypothetical protein
VSWLITARRKLVGLFVDDGSLALAILGWLLGGVICIHVFAVPPVAEGIILASGFVLLLGENVGRTARAATERRP